MPRTILLHLNVQASDDDARNADEIGALILAALEVGLEGAPGSLAAGADLTTNDGLIVALALCEEV